MVRVDFSENSWEAQILQFFNETIVSLELVGYEIVIAKSALGTLFAIYHLIFNARSWNSC